MNEDQIRIVDNALDHLVHGKMLCRKGHNALCSMEIEQAACYVRMLKHTDN